MSNGKDSRRVLAGLIIVVVGVWLLLSNVGVIDIHQPWRWFPLILVAIGLWTLVRTHFRQVVGPIILIAIGVAVQLTVLDSVPDRVRDAVWPVVIIVVGLVVLLRRSSAAGERTPRRSLGHDSAAGLNVVAVFWAANHRLSGDFRRGQATCLFGSVNVDLRDVQIPQPPAVLDLTCMFGGAEIRVPAGWNIRNDIVAIFGGTDDKRSTAAATGGPVQLSIQGLALFGGLVIRD